MRADKKQKISYEQQNITRECPLNHHMRKNVLCDQNMNIKYQEMRLIAKKYMNQIRRIHFNEISLGGKYVPATKKCLTCSVVQIRASSDDAT